MSQVSYVTNKGLPGLPILRLDSNMVEITRDYNLYRKQNSRGLHLRFR